MEGCSCTAWTQYTWHPKKYTFTRRAEPVWTTIEGGGRGCVIELRTANVLSRRVKISAISFMGPLMPGNKSVATQALDMIGGVGEHEDTHLDAEVR